MAGGPAVSVDVVGLLGSSCGVGNRGAALFSDDSGHFMLHSAGRYVAFRHVDTNETVFVPPEKTTESIAACAVSRDRSRLAVCERGSQDPFNRVKVFDLTEPATPTAIKTVVPMPGSPASVRVVGLAFSCDPEARFLAIVTTSVSEVALHVVEWEFDRHCGKCKLDGNVDRVAFTPAPDSCQISVSGTNVMRIVQLRDATSKIRDPSLKVQPGFAGFEEGKCRITDHAWVEQGAGLLACNADGPLYLFATQEMNLVGVIENPFGQDSEALPLSLYSFSEGFVLAGSDGLVSVWERTDDSVKDHPTIEQFQHVRTARVGRPGTSITSIDMTSTEETLLVGCKNGDLILAQMASILGSRNGVAECSVISGGYHAGPVASLDIAAQRPLAVTVGKKDKVVRVWNYATKQCELRWQSMSGDPPYTAAMHPFGYFLAVSFSEKLRFFHVLKKDLRLHREFAVRNIRLLRFSHGGHLLAASQGKAVHIFSTRTLTKVTTLQDHANIVSDLCFDPEDHRLWSCSTDGMLIEWDVSNWTKVNETTSNYDYLAASSWSGGQVVVSGGLGSKAVLQRYVQGQLEHEYVLPQSKDKVKLGSLCHFPGSGVTLAGTTDGSLRLYPPPPTHNRTRGAPTVAEMSAVMADFSEYGLHAGACIALRLSADGRTLISAGEDGAVFILEVSGIAPFSGSDDGAAERGGEGDAHLLGTEAVLVERQEIEKRLSESKALRAETLALKSRMATEAQRLEEECEAKVAEARQKDQADIEELSRRCRTLEAAQEAKARESDRVMTSMESSHKTAKHQLNHLYEKKVTHEEERFMELKDQQAMMQEMIEAAKEQLKQQLQRDEQKALEDMTRMLAEKDQEIQKHKDFIAFLQHRFDGVLASEGESHDVEVVQNRMSAHQNLLEQKQVEVKLRREQETLLRGLEMMEEDRAQIEKEEQDASARIRELKDQAEDLTRMLNSLKVERTERESTLNDKEQRIESYKVKFNTLKKFKHVLDKRLAEVTSSLQPKEKLIEQLNGHLEELEFEFEKQLVDARQMEGAISQKRQQLASLAAECQKLREVIKEKDRLIGRYNYDLHNLITETPDQKVWPQEIRRMYHAYVCGERGGEERLPLEAMQRQMCQVERRVASLAVKGGQMRQACKSEIQRKANDSGQLVHEVNELRMQRKSLQMSVRGLQKKLEELERPNESTAQLLNSASAPMRLEDGDAGPTSDAESPSAPDVGMPRTPSGSLPGPRQQQSAPRDGRSSPLELAGSRKKPTRTKSVPPLSAAKVLRASPEDKLRLQHVMLTEQINMETVKVQADENKLLRNKIEALFNSSSTKKPGSAGVESTPGLMVASQARPSSSGR
mmetsp:Transcript_56384/g.145162  ORF Transcript_56384/g.145162 Transcript_56384/m.145162 type:complete len:1345 (-) Transcript_56384:95-4129(-)